MIERKVDGFILKLCYVIDCFAVSNEEELHVGWPKWSGSARI